MFSLSGKVAFITGTSSGIGVGIAKILANQGASVVLAARRVERSEGLAAQIREYGHQALPLPVDVTDIESVRWAVGETINTFGRLDILVNNAGVLDMSPLENVTIDSWYRVIDTNLKGYLFTTQSAVPEMEKNGWGRVVNIASIAMGGVGIGMPGLSTYCTSKAGVIGFTEALATELAPKNITVNSISPGLIESEMSQPTLDNADALNAILQRIPLAKGGKPEDIGAGVAYLASEEAGYVTGANLVIDGGWLAG